MPYSMAGTSDGVSDLDYLKERAVEHSNIKLIVAWEMSIDRESGVHCLQKNEALQSCVMA